MFCVVWDYSCSKLKGKKYKQNSLLKSYKNEIKILANPGLAYSGFEKPGPDHFILEWWSDRYALSSLVASSPSLISVVCSGYKYGIKSHRKITHSNRYPFIDLSGQRHCESYVSCPSHNTTTTAGFERSPLDLGHKALDIRPPRLPHTRIWILFW